MTLANGMTPADGRTHRTPTPRFRDPRSGQMGRILLGLRYVSVIKLAGGGTRFYVEVTRADGAHDLRTVHVPAS